MSELKSSELRIGNYVLDETNNISEMSGCYI